LGWCAETEQEGLLAALILSADNQKHKPCTGLKHLNWLDRGPDSCVDQ